MYKKILILFFLSLIIVSINLRHSFDNLELLGGSMLYTVVLACVCTLYYKLIFPLVNANIFHVISIFLISFLIYYVVCFNLANIDFFLAIESGIIVIWMLLFGELMLSKRNYPLSNIIHSIINKTKK